jgi:polyphosphate kinase
MVRVSGVMEVAEAGLNVTDISGKTPDEQLEGITEKAKRLTDDIYDTYNNMLSPLLERENIHFRTFGLLTDEQVDFTRNYFNSTLFPILTPMAIDQSHPFPFLANKSLNIIAEIETIKNKEYLNDYADKATLFSVINVPSVVPRYLRLPSDRDDLYEYILIEDVIKAYMRTLFSGFLVKSGCVFRITRDSDLEIDEEDAVDLLDEVEKSVRNRKWGEPVRMEIERSMTPKLRDFLEDSLDTYSMVFCEVDGPLDFTFFFGFGKLFTKNERLYDPPYPPVPAVGFMNKNVFEAIRENDILVHHPYESFDCVTNYVKAAATDPKVLAIKQTLYRVSGDSPIIAALIQAAENGKHVTVLVELKARFDEENNIVMARKLEKAGCHVVYGLVGLKTHCKMCLVVRMEDEGVIRRYLHLGTGNYNDTTATVYTDFGFFTCCELFAQDISALFNVLTGYSLHFNWNKILVAPVSLRSEFTRLIEGEKIKALNGKPSRIVAKMNSLSDPEIISALYAAGVAGVKIDLMVRGICCLRPEVPGLSENISVCSVVGRFLEHHRIFAFGEGDEAKIYLSSADWMPRNLDRRVEIAFPIEDAGLKAKLFGMMELMFSETAKMRVMLADGTYKRFDKENKKYVNSQETFYERVRDEYGEKLEKPLERLFVPVGLDD